jgi:hypothetical protein
MSSFADFFLQVDMSPNAEQSGSPGDLDLDKRSDVPKAIPDAGQDELEGDDAEGDEAKGKDRKDSAEKPEAINGGDKDPAKTGSAKKSCLPMDSDGDVMMNVHGDTHGTTSVPPPLNDQPPASSPAPADAMPASTSGDNSPPAPSTHPSLSIAPAPLASGRSSTLLLHPSDEGAPSFLSPATLAHLCGTLPAEAWQNLITTFLCFEKVSLPTGVCFYFAGFSS